MRDPSAKFSTCGAPICKAGSADPASPLSWRFQKDIAGAGTLGDIASHVIDIAQYLAGDIEAVTGHDADLHHRGGRYRKAAQTCWAP